MMYEYLLLIIAGAISVLAFAPFNFMPVIVLAMLIVMWVLNRHRQKSNYNLWRILGYGYCFAIAYFMTQLYWIFYSLYYIIHANVWVSIIALVGFSIFLATYIALALVIYVRYKTRSLLFNQLYFFPSIWVLFEWLRGWVLGGFSWCDIGYTQVNNHLFSGFFPLAGEYSVSWLTISLIGVLYVLLVEILPQQKAVVTRSKSKNLSNARGNGVRATIYLLVVVLAGTLLAPIKYTKPYGKPTTIALIQGNILATAKWANQTALTVYANIIKNTHADLILIPETAIAQFAMDLPPGYLDRLAHYAKHNGADLIIGIPVIIDDEYNYVNAAMLLTNKAHPYYAKYHLVPYGEYIPAKWLLGRVYNFVNLPMVNFSAGKRYQLPLVVGNQKLAFNICFENGFGQELLYAAAKATLMVNLSDMAWYGTTIAMNEHLQLSQARALENQRYFIQETNSSITAVISPSGEVVAQLPIFRRDVLHYVVQGMYGTTPYEYYGNWLIITICIVLVLIGYNIPRRVKIEEMR